jgi:hypothetical protein
MTSTQRGAPRPVGLRFESFWRKINHYRHVVGAGGMPGSAPLRAQIVLHFAGGT